MGTGTERVEEYLKTRFPSARVGRLDRDTASGKGLERVLTALRERRLDIMVGTQMVTKGHDFPHVTLVGVINADQGMGLPDFRASERTFQLLEQVAGRAGRAEKPGRVLVQTYSPQHPAIEALTRHDYLGFVERELGERKELSYPPYRRMLAVRIDGPEPEKVKRAAEAVAAAAKAVTARAPEHAGLEVMGPAPAPLGLLKGRTRWQLFVKAENVRGLRVMARAIATAEVPRGVRVGLDVDPISML
jgi:primosomal protein N' (replication factor Y)